MPEWNLTRLEHFVAVAESPSLSRAARRIHVSQPALTKSVRKLEEELGFPLFDRVGTLQLTPLGREFLPRARALLAQARDLDRHMQLISGADVGELSVGCGPSAADTIVGAALARVVDRRPGLRTCLRVAEVGSLLAPLRERELELVVAEVTAFEAEPDVAIEPLAPQEIVLFCRSGHPLAGKERVTPEEFFAYPHAATGLPPWAVEWLEARNPDKSSSPRLSVECSHHAVVNAVVAGSDAISGAPWPAIAKDVAAGRFALVRLEAPAMWLRPGIVRVRERTLSPAAQIFAEALRGVAGSSR